MKIITRKTISVSEMRLIDKEYIAYMRANIAVELEMHEVVTMEQNSSS